MIRCRSGFHLLASISCIVLLLLSGAARADFSGAQASLEAGNHVEAIAGFQELVEASPGYAYGHFAIGHSWAELGRFDEAIVSLLRAIELEERPNYRLALARARLSAGDAAEALATIDDGPNPPPEALGRFLLLRGRARVALERWSEAVSDLDRAVALEADPARRAPTLRLLGSIHRRSGDHARAGERYREALAIEDSPASRKGLIRALLAQAVEQRDESRRRSYEEAREQARILESASPDDFESAQLHGHAALGLGDLTGADRAFSRVLDLRPGHCNALLNRTQVLLLSQAWDAASLSGEVALECDSRHSGTVHGWLGYVHRRQRDWEASIRHYELAMESAPDDPRLAEALSQVRHNREVESWNLDADELNRRLEDEQQRLDEELRDMRDRLKRWELATRDD